MLQPISNCFGSVETGDLVLHVVAATELANRLAVQAGYRVLSAKPKDGADAVEFRMGGWHFGLELSL